MSAHHFHTDQFRKNDDVFRNTMESIFQKYSTLDDPGIDVCLKTMTCRTGRGSVPIDSVEGERELENLKLRVKENHSIREDFEDQENYQMELSGITEDNYTYSDQKDNDESLWHGGDSLQQSMNGINSSQSSLLGVTFQPIKDDEELEKTLSSHGSTLLDVYPGMLSQIGEAYRRQHVTDTARAVLQKYRRKQWHAGVSNPRVTSLRNRTLNNTTEMSFTKQSSVQENLLNYIRDSGKLQNFKKLKPSPLKNTSEASACFYSPRRDNANVSGMSSESQWTELHLDGKPKQNTARVIDFSTTPHSVSPSLSDQSPDLNKTYDVELTVLSTGVPPSLVSACPHPAWYSPGGTARALSLIEQRRMSQTTRPSGQQSSHTALDKDRFRGRLHSSVSSPQRFSCSSPSRMSIFKPVPMERQESMAVHNSMRKSPAHCQVHSELQRSPYGQKDKAMSSPQHSLYHRPEPQQSFSMAHKQTQISPRLSEHQRSFPGPKSACLSSRSHIDAEFRKLYHHFICHRTSSPCPSSGCNLCEKQLKTTCQSMSSMSALALTPLKIALKKRRRQPEVEESLRFKRFRESCSPVKQVQRLPHQLKDEYVSPSIAGPGKDRRTWERAILLQCPSPQFLRGTGNLRRIRESKLAMQMAQSTSSWRDVSSGVYAIKAESPLRPFNRGMTPISVSLSRRRLQYGLLQ